MSNEIECMIHQKHCTVMGIPIMRTFVCAMIFFHYGIKGKLVMLQSSSLQVWQINSIAEGYVI